MRNVFVCAAAILVAATSAFGDEPAKGSLLDQLHAAGGPDVLKRDPTLIRYSTVGVKSGICCASALSDEYAETSKNLLSGISEIGASLSEVVELRIETRSAADEQQVARLVAADPRLAALPISWRRVSELKAKRARVGLEVALKSAVGAAGISAKFGSNR